MTNQPTNQPAPAPATSVAAPAPQGTLGDKKLRVLIFGRNEYDLKNHMYACTSAGHEPIGVIVSHPSVFGNYSPERLDKLRKPKGVDHIIGTAAQAKAVVDKVNPDVIITNDTHHVGYGATQDSTNYANLVNNEIPATFPPATPHIIKTVLGDTIHMRDEKAGQGYSRIIDLNAFLKEEAEKLNAQGRTQG